MQPRFTLKCIQYMVTSVLQREQYTFDVRKWYVGRNLHKMRKCNQSFDCQWLGQQPASFFASGIKKLADR